MKKLATLVALAALAAGCSSTDNANMATRNGNVGTVVNNNANTAANTSTANANTANANHRTYNANISEADYEKDKARYGTEAKEAGETVGSGLKDGYLWVKTKGALAAVDDLRDSTINVDVDNGVITLRGDVASPAQKSAAVKAANGIDGKKSVSDKLVVKADGAANANANTKAGAAHSGNANH
ncbi:MAG: hyperosmotically inducible periplasmic protein [Acidobacteriota bacterium]|nr:hyperosmotically inducible periplasmic protein [Acidobacteriota bacterium]